MAVRSDLEDVYEQHQGLRAKLPNAWNAFFARFGNLRPVQLNAIPPILAGKNVLVTAPTAGGKTEAAAAPLCERIVGRRWPGLAVVLITPTRALVNDLFHRLEKPCGDMRVRVGRKTADHAISDRLDEQFLVTTPESLESLMTFRRETLATVRAVVVDEVHLLDGTPRGDQLRLLLSRLSAYLHHCGGKGFAGLQRVAMSATVPDPRQLANAYLGAGSEIVAVPGQRQLEERIIVADGPVAARARAAVDAMAEFPEVKKVLVFFNSRKEVDLGPAAFQQGLFERVPVFGHHGSLSKYHREQAESRFKSEPRAICVATMTLEVGIDIGDIDLVVCMDPPYSQASFLQRIGRGCRRLAGRTRVLCVARNRAGETLFRAMVRQAGLGLPVGPLKPFRTSVLVQQVLAYLKQVERNCRTIEQFLRVLTTAAAPEVTEHRVKLVLADLVARGLLDKRGQIFQPASLGWEFIQSSRIYSNIEPTPSEVTLVDADTGIVVANVASVSGDHVRVAGRTYQLLPGSKPGEQRVRSGTSDGGSARYHTARLPYAADIGAAVAGFLGVEPGTLLVVPAAAGGGATVMTWLGKLLNTALAVSLAARGYKVRPRAFAISVEDLEPPRSLEMLVTAVAEVTKQNPLGGLKVEQMVDVGPHFEALSDELKQRARQDWLDVEYLNKWCVSLGRVVLVEAETELGQRLLELA